MGKIIKYDILTWILFPDFLTPSQNIKKKELRVHPLWRERKKWTEGRVMLVQDHFSVLLKKKKEK